MDCVQVASPSGREVPLANLLSHRHHRYRSPSHTLDRWTLAARRKRVLSLAVGLGLHPEIAEIRLIAPCEGRGSAAMSFGRD